MMAIGATRSAARWAIALTAGLLLTRLWFIPHRDFDSDEYEHLHATWLVAHGEIPYRDFFEHHTPALYFLGAPLFAHAPVETDPDAAVRALVFARGLMWILTVASVGAAHMLASLWCDATTGALAVLLLVSSAQFTYTVLEYRPDVPATLCLIVTMIGLAAAGRATRRRAAVLTGLAGAAYGVGYLCTPKVLFAAPGLAIAFALDEQRLDRLLTFGAGAVLPIAAAASWFAAHRALWAFYFYTVPTNIRLNAEHFSPWPRIVKNTVQQPALYGLAAAGLATALWTRRVPRGMWPLVAGALSFVAGLFALGSTYDQYYVLFLPLFAVVGAAWMQPRLRRTDWAIVAMVLPAAHSIAYHVRWVTSHTAPSDSYLGGSPTPPSFDPTPGSTSS